MYKANLFSVIERIRLNVNLMNENVDKTPVPKVCLLDTGCPNTLVNLDTAEDYCRMSTQTQPIIIDGTEYTKQESA